MKNINWFEAAFFLIVLGYVINEIIKTVKG